MGRKFIKITFTPSRMDRALGMMAIVLASRMCETTDLVTGNYESEDTYDIEFGDFALTTARHKPVGLMEISMYWYGEGKDFQYLCTALSRSLHIVLDKKEMESGTWDVSLSSNTTKTFDLRNAIDIIERESNQDTPQIFSDAYPQMVLMKELVK